MEPKDYYTSLYAGERRSGKTTRLLQRAQETGFPIVTHNTHMKRYLHGKADKLGIRGVLVFTVDEYKQGGLRFKKVIIDEVQLMLQQLLNVNVEAISVTTYDLIDLDHKQDSVDDGQLLSINVKDMQSVPVVKYKGEDITGKIEIDYHWRTSDAQIIGEHAIYLEHCDKDQLSVEKVKLKRLLT